MNVRALSFNFPLIIHPSSLDNEKIKEKNLSKSWGGYGSATEIKTVAEVAEDLEERYQILDTFSSIHNEDISRILSKELALAVLGKQTAQQAEEISSAKITTIFRDYLRKEEHGIKTKASRKRGTKSFIDTTTYMQSIYSKILSD